jgi:outer membrane protein TolC
MQKQLGTLCHEKSTLARAVITTTRKTFGRAFGSAYGRSWGRWILSAALASLLSPLAHAADTFEDALTLPLAVELALSDDPGLRGLEARGRAFDELAVSARQLPDPKVKMGVANIPVDSFDLSQEPMTQTQIGVSQSFPRGRSRSINSKKMNHLSDFEALKAQDLEGKIRLAVRKAWLERYYFEQTRAILGESRQVFQELVSFVESLYSTGRNTQQDVLRAELELQLLEDRLIDNARMIETSTASLAKWVGREANRSLPKHLPDLQVPASEAVILEYLGKHPSIRMFEKQIDVRKSDKDLARQDFKPGWKVDVGYGYRDGQDALGRDRSDFATAMLTFDVPIFYKKKQSRTLEARSEQVKAAQFRRDDQVRDLRRMLETEYAAWTKLDERERHYAETITQRADENVTASVQSYQANVTDFSNLMRAQLIQLDTQLKETRIQVDKLKTQAALLYLQGEPK